ncbi:hypothetical protein AGMMS49942_11920 [Spirochaetia bacterium]|nr:hypothetical protein AGMMS49942_11920 [Spirochaetia bacterium]
MKKLVPVMVMFLFSFVIAAYSQAPLLNQNPNIYMGFLSFDGGVHELLNPDGTRDSNFIELNLGSNEETILRAIDTYSKTGQDKDNGAALFYAVHWALDDLVKAGKNGRIPETVDSVYIVTITDSYDNASAAGTLRTDTFEAELSIEPADRRNELKYSEFIKQKLLETKISDRELPIRAYSLGLGMDTAGRPHLNVISSNPANEYVKNGRLEDFKRNLSAITQRINRVDNPHETLLTAVFTPPFDGTRFRFQVDERQPDYYIDGTVVYRENENWSITNITSVPETLYKPGSIKPVYEGAGKEYFSVDFTINGRNFSDGQRGKMYRINELRNGLAFSENTDAQVYVHKDPIAERKSVLVYFLLDDSKSMEVYKKDIKESLIRSIEYFKVGSNPQ